MAKISEDQIRQCKVFADARDGTIERLIENSRLVSYIKNRQIVGQADASTELFLVVKGTVRAKSYSEKGKEVSYRDFSDGELFGEFSAIDEAPRSAAVLAVGDCTVAKFAARYFREAVQNDSQVSLALIELLIEKNRLLTDRIHEFSTLAVRFRIQSELLRLAEASDGSNEGNIQFEIPTHSELASRVSTHREAVTKELNFLASGGLISIDKSVVKITDYERFKQVAGNLDW